MDDALENMVLLLTAGEVFLFFCFFCNAGTGYLLYVATNCVFITIHISWLTSCGLM